MNRAERFICAGCFILILIHLVASYFPHHRLWGLNLLYYMPSIWRWILTVCGLLMLIPSVNKTVYDLFSQLSRLIQSRLKGLNKYYGYGFLSMAAGIVFWLLRVKTYFLGDSNLRAKEINQGVTFSFTEPLDFLLHLEAVRFLRWDAFQIYVVLSVIAGVIFVFLVLLLADEMGYGKNGRFLVFILVFTMGANLLFFGYVESYTLVYIAIVGYLLFSCRCLQHKIGITIPVILLILATSLHLSALVLVPSLLYLIIWSNRTKYEGRGQRSWLWKLLLSSGVLLLIGIGLFLLQIYNPEDKGLGYYLISPLGNSSSLHSFFSSTHMFDFINHQLLVSPVGILVLFVSIFAFSGRMNIKDNVTRFLLVVSICSLAYALLVDPKLGYPRDWDLFAFTGLGYTLLGLHLFLNRWQKTIAGNLRYVILSLFFTSLVIVTPWIYVNTSEEKSVERFENILDMDEEKSAYGRENLAMHYSRRGESDKEIRQWRKAIAISNSARHITNLAVTYTNLGMHDLAMKELEISLKVDSTFDFTYFCKGEILLKEERYEEAIAAYREAIRFKPDRTQYYDNLGVVLSNMGRYEEAVVVFEEGIARGLVGYPSIYRNAGYTYFNMGNFSKAEKHLSTYLEQAPQADDRAEALQILETARQMKRKKGKP